MQKWARNLHLAVGVLTAPFLLMYAFSALQMAHSKWFKLNRVTTKTTLAIATGDATDGRAVARALMKRGAVAGEIGQIAAVKTGYRIHVTRPGAVYDIVYDATTGQAIVSETKSGAVFLLNRLHHLAGIDHQYGWLNAWGWMLGLTAVLLSGLGVTGIYLWFKMHGELVIGLALLAVSLGYSLTLLYSLR